MIMVKITSFVLLKLSAFSHRRGFTLKASVWWNVKFEGLGASCHSFFAFESRMQMFGLQAVKKSWCGGSEVVQNIVQISFLVISPSDV